jgi:hypothetical protein
MDKAHALTLSLFYYNSVPAKQDHCVTYRRRANPLVTFLAGIGGTAHSIRVPSAAAKLLMSTIGAPFAGMSRELGALYTKGSFEMQELVAIAMRHGLRLEGSD